MKNHIRISLFIDGGYDAKVNQFYTEVHPRRSPLHFSGLKNFVRKQVAAREHVAEMNCLMVQGHYFRGRLMYPHADVAAEWELDNALIKTDIATHYLPLVDGKEKGIDSLLALEAFELVMNNKVDVIALYAGDTDHISLVRKCTAAGVRILLLGWDFEYTDAAGKRHITHTSREVRDAVTYSLHMASLINNLDHHPDPSLEGIFSRSAANQAQPQIAGKIYGRPHAGDIPAA